MLLSAMRQVERRKDQRSRNEQQGEETGYNSLHIQKCKKGTHTVPILSSSKRVGVTVKDHDQKLLARAAGARLL